MQARHPRHQLTRPAPPACSPHTFCSRVQATCDVGDFRVSLRGLIDCSPVACTAFLISQGRTNFKPKSVYVEDQ